MILNKFPTDVPPCESIVIEYYILALYYNIAIFAKRANKKTLEENCVKALEVKKYILSIGVHHIQEDSKCRNGNKIASTNEFELKTRDTNFFYNLWNIKS